MQCVFLCTDSKPRLAICSTSIGAKVLVAGILHAKTAQRSDRYLLRDCHRLSAR